MSGATQEGQQNPVCAHCRTVNPPDAQTCTQCGEVVAVAPPDPFIGTCLGGKYDIDKKLGEGGMGSVYKARQRPIDRPVCLKVINPGLVSDPTVFRRFQMEAEMASKVKHPSAVEIYDFARMSDGNAIIVMEYVPGILLTEIIEKQFPIPPQRTIQILSHVSDVLEVGHRINVIHRDLKPDNIMVYDLPTEKDFAKLLDYGIAKSDEQQAGATQLTMAGTAIGTPEYMAPEQITGQPIGPFTDVYALGVILYYMLCGALPFEGSSPVEFFTKHVREEPVPPSKRGRVSGIHPELEKLVMWSLKKRAEERTPSMLEFKRALEKALPSSAAPSAGTPDASADLMKNLLGDALANFDGRVELEKKNLVMAFVDLVPDRETQTPESEKALLAKAVDAAERHDGVAERIVGTRMLVLFGSHQVTGREAEQCISCAQEMLQIAPQSSVALHYGPVDIHQEGARYSESVEVCERAALYAAQSQVVALEAFTEMANAAVQFRGMAPLTIKGIEDPLSIFEVISVESKTAPGASQTISRAPTLQADQAVSQLPTAKDGSAVAQSAGSDDSASSGVPMANGGHTVPSHVPFVGREVEGQSLAAFYHHVQQGHGCSLMVAGPPGIGKTRLLKETMEKNPQVRHVLVNCRSRKVLNDFLTDLGVRESPLEHRMFLNWLLGSAFEPPQGLSAEDVLRGIVAAVRGQIMQAAAESPLVIVFDDFDSANEIVQSFVLELMNDVAPLKTLLVIAGRQLHLQSETTQRMELTPLSAEETQTLFSRLAPAMSSHAEQWLGSTGGIPAAILQLAEAAKEGALNMGEGVDPANALQAVIEARLNALAAPTIELMAVAAAIGEECSEDVLLGVMHDMPGGKPELDTLVERGLLLRDQDSGVLRFSSANERNIAYGRLPTERMTIIHQRAAQKMEEAGEAPEIVAAQFEGARDYKAALTRLRQAAIIWLDQKEKQRSIACYRRAVMLGQQQPGEERRAAEDALALGRLLQEQGLLEEADAYLAQGETAASEQGDRRLVVQISCERVRILIEKNDFTNAEQSIGSLMQEGNNLQDVVLLCDLMGLAGECAERAGHDVAASQRVLKSIELAQQVPGEDGVTRAVQSLGRLGRIELRCQRPDTAMKFFNQQKTAAQQIDDPISEAKAIVNIAAVHQSLGALDESMEALDEGLELSRETGDLLTAAKALHNGGCIRFQKGELFEAKAKLKESLSLSQQIGWREGVAMNDAWLRRLQS